MDTYTLKTLREHILFRCHAKGAHLDPTTNTESVGFTNLANLVNQWKDQIISANNWTWRQGHFSQALKSSEFDMPADFGSLIYLTIADYRLDAMNIQDFRSRYQDGNEGGTPRWYIPWGATNGRHRYRLYPFSAVTIFCDYNKTFPDLKQAQDTLTMTTGIPEGIVGLFQKALVEGVLSEVFDYQNAEAKSLKAERKYMAHIQQMRDEDVDRNEVGELERHGDFSTTLGRLGSKYGE